MRLSNQRICAVILYFYDVWIVFWRKLWQKHYCLPKPELADQNALHTDTARGLGRTHINENGTLRLSRYFEIKSNPSFSVRTYRLRVGFTWANKISQHSESFLETHMPHSNYNLLVRKFYIRLGWMPILLATTYFFLQKIITYLGTF